MNNFTKRNLNLYKSFYEVALEKSYTKAAEKLYISQPTLSYNVKTLEKELNLKLFSRNKNGIKLTSDGNLLFDTLDVIFNLLDETEEKIVNKNNISGAIRIGTTRSIADYYLVDYINDFIQKYPEINIIIQVHPSSKLIEMLENNELDVVFDNLPIAKTEQEINTTVVYSFNCCFACNKNLYEKLSSQKVSITDLAKYDLVLPGKSEKRRNIDKLSIKKDIVLNPKVELPNSDLMIELVKRNNYIGLFIEDSIEEELKNRILYKINLKEKIEDNKVIMISLKKMTNIMPKVFMEFIENRSK